ncbi:MAG: GNAT family N-acetyltransferase [Eubacteriales bacterium]|nr:GNAT family N-acetyltransferase [Eubacteriales bacterium]
MDRVRSSAQFASLVKEYKREHGRVQSNCFFLPSEVEEMCRKEKLFVQETKEGLYFFVVEEECSRMYYYIEKSQAPSIELNKYDILKMPVILDYVFKEEEGEALKKAGSSKWLEKGFRPYKRYRRMECTREQFNAPDDYIKSREKFRIVKMKPKDYKAVAMLWRSGLDVYSTFLQEREEYEESCEKGEIIGVSMEDGTPGAVNMAIKKGRTAFLQHLAVSPGLRGIGMGKALFCATMDFVLNQYGADKANFWVDEENFRAVGMYRKVGFINDGMVSRQFILD